MKFSTAIDSLAVAGFFLLGAAAYCYDPRLLLIFAGVTALLAAGFLSRLEARRQAAARVAAENSEV